MLVTIVTIFLLYFVVLVFARRNDKRDEDKVGEKINEVFIISYEMEPNLMA